MSRQTEKITALYERLSRDDEAIGDSNSIINQKLQLESYAAQHGFMNCVHYTDDGWSGGNFERPDWKRLIADIEAGKIGCVIAKDMSRIGRDYLQTGFYTEVMFRERGVRFIAIGNGVDSADQSTGEFAPFINIMSEWYLRDCSRKQKAAYQVRGRAGKPTTNHAIIDGMPHVFRFSENMRDTCPTPVIGTAGVKAVPLSPLSPFAHIDRGALYLIIPQYASNLIGTIALYAQPEDAGPADTQDGKAHRQHWDS